MKLTEKDKKTFLIAGAVVATGLTIAGIAYLGGRAGARMVFNNSILEIQLLGPDGKIIPKIAKDLINN